MVDVEVVLDVVVNIDLQDSGVTLHVPHHDQVVGRSDAEVVCVTGIVFPNLLTAAAFSVVVRVITRVGESYQVANALAFATSLCKTHFLREKAACKQKIGKLCSCVCSSRDSE